MQSDAAGNDSARPLMNLTLFEFVLSFDVSPYIGTFLERVLHGGFLYILFHVLYVISSLGAVCVIFCGKSLPWKLLASLGPLCMTAFAASIGSLSCFTLMTSPSEEVIAAYLIHNTRLFWLGAVTTLVLAILIGLLALKNRARPK